MISDSALPVGAKRVEVGVAPTESAAMLGTFQSSERLHSTCPVRTTREAIRLPLTSAFKIRALRENQIFAEMLNTHHFDISRDSVR